MPKPITADQHRLTGARKGRVRRAERREQRQPGADALPKPRMPRGFSDLEREAWREAIAALEARGAPWPTALELKQYVELEARRRRLLEDVARVGEFTPDGTPTGPAKLLTRVARHVAESGARLGLGGPGSAPEPEPEEEPGPPAFHDDAPPKDWSLLAWVQESPFPPANEEGRPPSWWQYGRSDAQAQVRSRQQLKRRDAKLARLIHDQIPDWDPWALQPAGAYFDIKEARFAIAWIERWCRLVEGPKAGQPFVLEPFQAAVVATVWGFRLEDGRRRFRKVWFYVGKGNAKSSLTAAIILLVMATDGEMAAKCYSVASTQKQTHFVFDHVSGMVRHQRALKDRFRVLGDKGGTVHKSVVDYETMSKYETLASDADATDGSAPHLAVIDEVHRHRTGELMDVLIRSSRKRAQPLIFMTTTADYARESVCNTELTYALQVRENGGDPDRPGFDAAYLPCVWKADPAGDWKDPAAWRKANPALGTIKTLESMEEACREAQDKPSLLGSFLRLDLNIVTETYETWLSAEDWDACSGDLSVASLLEAMRGEVCYGGMDLASKTDLCAVVLYFPEHGVLLVWFWIPRKTASLYQKKAPKRFLFTQWAHQGYLTITDGARADYGLIREKIRELRETYEIREIGYDPYNAQETVAILQEEGFVMVEMRQGPMTLGEATKELEALVVDHKLRHGGHPVLRWNALNTKLRFDANLNPMPSKKHSDGQIDGIAAGVMALAGAIVQEVEDSLDDCYADGEELYV